MIWWIYCLGVTFPWFNSGVMTFVEVVDIGVPSVGVGGSQEVSESLSWNCCGDALMFLYE